MKFPYGISDFKEVVTQDYFYCDRTDKIPLLEEYKYILFLRPRRFGKSLLLSMLENYYDIAQKDSFEQIFGHLAIGKNPTSYHNKYFILKLDFSCIDPSGSADSIKRSFYDHINARIKGFKLYYKDYSIPEIEIDRNNAIYSINSLVESIRKTQNPLYLLIDEYDNFANEVMMSVRLDKDIYEALVYEEGPLKTVFKAIKASAGSTLFDRIFITGVSPVVMSDITSGYNIAENIYIESKFNDLCGFTQKEIESVIKEIVSKCGFSASKEAEALDIMRLYYDGYNFSYQRNSGIYNPTLALYFLKRFYEDCSYPRNMMDRNLSADEAKLRYISNLPQGKELILEIAKDNNGISISDLEDRFGINQMLLPESKDYTFMASFLYYFGVLTMAGETSMGKLLLKTPNLVTQGLYIKRIREIFLPDPGYRDEGIIAAEKLYQQGDIRPVCEFIEQRFFKVLSNRDYRWANELTVKTAFLTLLYNDILYIMDSEKPAGRKFTDLTMIIRQDMREFDIYDILLEFKFVSLKEASITGEQAKSLSLSELEALPAMRSKMEEAQKMLEVYGAELEKKYGNLRLKKFAVVSLGFERILNYSYD